MSTRARARRIAAVAGERPEDLPVHKCGRYGHKSKRTKKLCRQNVIAGTEACRHHSGRPVVEQKARGLIRLELARWTLDGHDGADLDPRLEILRLISFWKWKANLYSGLLQQAYAAAEAIKASHAAGKLILADPEQESRFKESGEYDGITYEDPALQTARADLERIFTHGGVAALVGHKYDVDRDGRIYAADEGIRALVLLEKEALLQVANTCKLAVQAKVAESRIEMAQMVGVMIQAVILGVLRDKGLPANDAEVHALVVKHIDMVTTPLAIGAAA